MSRTAYSSPRAPTPAAPYEPAVSIGQMIAVSGQGRPMNHLHSRAQGLTIRIDPVGSMIPDRSKPPLRKECDESPNLRTSGKLRDGRRRGGNAGPARYVGETGQSVIIEEGVQRILAGNALEHAGVPNDSVVGYRFGEAADRWIINQGETALQLIGDCELANPETGVILTAPNGTRYRARVDNEGTLTTEAVA